MIYLTKELKKMRFDRYEKEALKYTYKELNCLFMRSKAIHCETDDRIKNYLAEQAKKEENNVR
ncbi:MAG: hypothetical protein GY950_33240 [bacterium]|nr:hypothetical protein [bacterium]